jgi:hypothetical protein
MKWDERMQATLEIKRATPSFDPLLLCLLHTMRLEILAQESVLPDVIDERCDVNVRISYSPLLLAFHLHGTT